MNFVTLALKICNHFTKLTATAINGEKTKRHPLTKIITDVVLKEQIKKMKTWTKLLNLFTDFGSEQCVSAAWHRKCKVELLVATLERGEFVPNFLENVWCFFHNFQTTKPLDITTAHETASLLAKNAISKKVKTVLRPYPLLALCNLQNKTHYFHFFEANEILRTTSLWWIFRNMPACRFFQQKR